MRQQLIRRHLDDSVSDIMKANGFLICGVRRAPLCRIDEVFIVRSCCIISSIQRINVLLV